MKAMASDIAGPSEEVVLKDEADTDISEGDKSDGDNESDAVKLDDTIDICKKAGFG